MKKLYILIFIVALSLSGCQQNPTQLTSKDAQVSGASETTRQNTEGSATSITFDGADSIVLDNGASIDDINGYLNAKSLHGWDETAPDYTKIRNGYFEVYNCAITGIMLFKEKYSDDSQMTFIECDSGMVTFQGINSEMNFSEIQECLAPAPVVKVEHFLAGIESYELRYIINGVKMKFVSSDELGTASWTLMFVREFEPNEGYLKLSANQISMFFSMEKEELANYLGVGIEDQNEIQIDGLIFRFQNERLAYIEYEENYEMAGIRSYFNSSDIERVLGKREITFLGGEDAFYTANYEFENFDIEIIYSSKDGDFYLPFEISFHCKDIDLGET